jgi:hypothetical protein
MEGSQKILYEAKGIKRESVNEKQRTYKKK